MIYLSKVTAKAMLGYVVHIGDRLVHLRLSRFGYPEGEHSVCLWSKRAVELSVTFPVVL